jgi:hypothetical protein
MRLIIYSIIAIVSFNLGSHYSEYKRNREELRIVDGGYHSSCKQIMGGKKGGLPCSRCQAMIRENNEKDPFFEHKQVIEYMSRKLGKDFEKFTDSEFYELTQMLFDLDK